jgi:hypothetical protein
MNLEVIIVGFEIKFEDENDDDSNWCNLLTVLFFPVMHVNQQILMK